MVHVALRAVPGTLLFRNHAEARALWDRFALRLRVLAVALMPDHLHLAFQAAAQVAAIVIAMRGYALWRHHRRGTSGPVWRPMEEPEPIRDWEHLRRTVRYIHLNPCRARLVRDPLAWPWSTHRDAVGLAVPGAVRQVADPDRFHAFVSGDPSVQIAGTRLPVPVADATPGDVFAAVSALTRTPAAALRTRGPARSLFLRAARALTEVTSDQIAAVVGADGSAVRHDARVRDPRIEIVRRVVGDPRFARLDDGDLGGDPAWRALRRRI